MPALVSPALVSPGLSSTSLPARTRNADEPQGRSFHAALDRSRASQADADTADGTTSRPGTPRRGASTAKDDALPEIPNLAFFAPAVPAQVTAAAARAGAEAVTTAALRGAATATERTAAQAALATTDAAADAAKAVTELDLPAADAAAKAALPEGEAADAALADALRTATGKAPTTATTDAAAAAAAATKTDAAAVPTTPAASSLLNAALASTLPATPTTPAAARTGRADTATRDTSATAVTAKAAAATEAADATEADPLDMLAARIEAASGSDNPLADDGASTAPVAWMANPSGGTGAANTSAADARMPVLSLAPPVDSDAWAPALGQQMLRMSASGVQSAQINLNPENLGPLQITLKLGDDQAQATFVSAHEGVRKAVEAALPQLRTSLAEHGISLGQTAVGPDTRQPGGQSHFAGDNPSARSGGNGGNGGSSYPGAARSGAAASSAAPAAPVRSARAEGVVDTFA